MSYTVEKDWTTEAGLRAAVILIEARSDSGSPWRCGYVGLPIGHPLYGCKLRQKTEILERAAKIAEELPVGKRGAIDLVLLAGDDSPNRLMTPNACFDVHGSLSYVGQGLAANGYPVDGELWWFGFDCDHIDDDMHRCPPRYVELECESLAKQIAEACKETQP